MTQLANHYIVAYGDPADLILIASDFECAMISSGRGQEFTADIYDSPAGRAHLLIEYTDEKGREFPELDRIFEVSADIGFVFASRSTGRSSSVAITRYHPDEGFMLSLFVLHMGKLRLSGDYERRTIQVMEGEIEAIANDPDLAFAFDLLGYPLGMMNCAAEAA